jgi:cell division protein FtsB
MKNINLFGWIIVVAFFNLSLNLANLINQEFRLQKYSVMLEQDLEAVRGEEKQLKHQLNFYASTQGVEELARKQLSYYRKDEVPVRVIASNPQNTISTTGVTRP